MNYVPIVHLNQVDSTNIYSKKLIEEDNIEKGFVISDIQTKGKGRYGKNWISKKGNIYLSFFFKFKTLNIKKFFLIFPVLIKKVLEKYSKFKILIKWPNDIIINNKKICGILVEHLTVRKHKFVIVGIGINVNSSPYIKKYPTIYLKKIKKKNFILQDVINDLLKVLSKISFKKINYKNFIKIWNSSLYLMNQEIKFLKKKDLYKGILKEIDLNGKLVLMINQKKIKFEIGSIL